MPPRDRLTRALWTLARPVRAALSGQPVTVASLDVPTAGGWDIHLRIARPVPRARRSVPGVLVVPGLGMTTRTLEGWTYAVQLGEFARLGLVAVAVDLSGTGRSWGTNVYGGPEHQDDVRAALRTLAACDDVDVTRLGVVSLSLGCAATAGALATGDRPPVQWWIDWEGPSDREIITAGGRGLAPAMGHDLGDDAYWYPREAARFVGRTGVPYLRYQSRRDHAQPGELRHAERMIRAAASGTLPWFRLNDHAQCAVPSHPTWMPDGPRAARAWLHRTIRALSRLP